MQRKDKQIMVIMVTTMVMMTLTMKMTMTGSRDGAVVRALASHQCGPRSTPSPGVILGLSFFLVLVLAPRGFSPGAPVFPSPQKPTFPNFNSIRNPRATGVSVPDCQVSPSLDKVYLFIYDDDVEDDNDNDDGSSGG